MSIRKTQQVITALKISYAQAIGTLRAEKIVPPLKDESGDYLWSDEDVKALKEALATDFRRKENRSQAKAHREAIRQKRQDAYKNKLLPAATWEAYAEAQAASLEEPGLEWEDLDCELHLPATVRDDRQGSSSEEMPFLLKQRV